MPTLFDWADTMGRRHAVADSIFMEKVASAQAIGRASARREHLEEVLLEKRASRISGVVGSFIDSGRSVMAPSELLEVSRGIGEDALITKVALAYGPAAATELLLEKLSWNPMAALRLSGGAARASSKATGKYSPGIIRKAFNKVTRSGAPKVKPVAGTASHHQQGFGLVEELGAPVKGEATSAAVRRAAISRDMRTPVNPSVSTATPTAARTPKPSPAVATTATEPAPGWRERVGSLFGRSTPAPAAAAAPAAPEGLLGRWDQFANKNTALAGAGVLGVGGAGYLGVKHLQNNRTAGY